MIIIIIIIIVIIILIIIIIVIITGVGKFGDEGTENKAKWGFMQKYYHKGVFYMDEDRSKFIP